MQIFILGSKIWYKSRIISTQLNQECTKFEYLRRTEFDILSF